MPILLKPERIKRYGDIARLLVKYGWSDLVKNAGLDATLDPATGDALQEATPRAEELAADLERLGPTYVKLGQLLSTRPDLLPMPYLHALARLQDEVEPLAFEDVELGVRLDDVYVEFDRVPLAAASLGQVHRAELVDGRQVAVKVQRPNIREQLLDDLELLRELAGFLDTYTEVGRRYEFRRLLEELRVGLLRELDYRLEAANLEMLGANLGRFRRIVVPRAIDAYTTARVLTMDYVSGVKVTSLEAAELLASAGNELADEFFHAYLRQMFVDGFFHADPHPGNILVVDDGRLALLDLGLVGRIPPRTQELLLQLLLAVGEGRGDEAAEYALKVGEPKEDFDRAGFRLAVETLVARHRRTRLDQIDVGEIVLEIPRVAADHGVRLPREFTLIAKTLLHLESVVGTLDPDFDVTGAIHRHASEMLRERVVKGLSPETILNAVLEVRDIADRLPRRVNTILDAVANNELQVKVDAIDETVLAEMVQKVANRISLSLLLAALVVGAALLARVDTPFTVLGYPVIAIVFFLAAASGGVALAIDILLTDRRQGRRGRR
jgi:predicted unusual protein kinase regulating ubiquinone biosynthesis (AarF/ABC1/UbiB family)